VIEYVTGDVNEDYLTQLELLRNDSAKNKQDNAEQSVVELYNAP